MHQICHFYGLWISSSPFDVGNTTRNGLSKCSSVNPDPNKAWLAATKGPGKASLSNGAMMRMAPLAVWCLKLSERGKWAELEKAIKLDVTLTHARTEMTFLCTAYSVCIG